MTMMITAMMMARTAADAIKAMRLFRRRADEDVLFPDGAGRLTLCLEADDDAGLPGLREEALRPDDAGGLPGLREEALRPDDVGGLPVLREEARPSDDGIAVRLTRFIEGDTGGRPPGVWVSLARLPAASDDAGSSSLKMARILAVSVISLLLLSDLLYSMARYAVSLLRG